MAGSNVEIKLPNKDENLVKAYNIAQISKEIKLEVEVTTDWIIIKQATRNNHNTGVGD